MNLFAHKHGIGVWWISNEGGRKHLRFCPVVIADTGDVTARTEWLQGPADPMPMGFTSYEVELKGRAMAVPGEDLADACLVLSKTAGLRAYKKNLQGFADGMSLGAYNLFMVQPDEKESK